MWGIVYYVTAQDDGRGVGLLGSVVRSARSVKPLGLPTLLFTDLPVSPEMADALDEIRNPGDMHYRRFRAEIFDLSPFDETLHLDADTVLIDDNLELAWRAIQKHGMAAAIPGDSTVFCGYTKVYEIIRYAPNVMFFNKSPEVKAVFDKWREVMNAHKLVLCEDEFLGIACHMLNWQPYVLPQCWNYKPEWREPIHGKVKFWNSVYEPPKDINRLWKKVRQQWGNRFAAHDERINLEGMYQPLDASSASLFSDRPAPLL